ncbi:MAG: GDSL-type esterase/lipase family protein [Planctomycetota bacterium]
MPDATPPAPRPSRRRARALLVVASILATLLLCELGARLYAWRQEARTLEAWQRLDRERPPPEPGAPLRFEGIIRLAQNPRIVYELIPNLDVEYLGVPLRTNALGFRGPEVAVPKPAGTFRVLVLGDSVAFGHGVRDEDGFARQLEVLLREACPAHDVDVVNTAVPGHNTAMEVATLIDKGLALQPDLVVYLFVGNDLDLPNLIWNPQDFWTVGRSFLWEQMRKAWAARDPWVERPWRAAPNEGGRFVYLEGAVAPMYRDMVGIEMFRRELERLRDLGRERGFRVLVTAAQDDPPYLRPTCNMAGLRFAGALDRIQQYMRARGIEKFWPSELTLSATDPHPTPVVHRMLAETVADDLQAAGWLPR